MRFQFHHTTRIFSEGRGARGVTDGYLEASLEPTPGGASPAPGRRRWQHAQPVLFRLRIEAGATGDTDPAPGQSAWKPQASRSVGRGPACPLVGNRGDRREDIFGGKGGRRYGSDGVALAQLPAPGSKTEVFADLYCLCSRPEIGWSTSSRIRLRRAGRPSAATHPVEPRIGISFGFQPSGLRI
jgi:hypothetical protein